MIIFCYQSIQYDNPSWQSVPGVRKSDELCVVLGGWRYEERLSARVRHGIPPEILKQEIISLKTQHTAQEGHSHVPILFIFPMLDIYIYERFEDKILFCSWKVQAGLVWLWEFPGLLTSPTLHVRYLCRGGRGRRDTAWCRCSSGWRGAPAPLADSPPGTCGGRLATATCQTADWKSSVRPCPPSPWSRSGPPQSRAGSRAWQRWRSWPRSDCTSSRWSSVRGMSIRQSRPGSVCTVLTPVSFRWRIWAASSLSTLGRNQMGCVLISLSRAVTGREELQSELESDMSSLIPLSRRRACRQYRHFTT